MIFTLQYATSLSSLPCSSPTEHLSNPQCGRLPRCGSVIDLAIDLAVRCPSELCQMTALYALSAYLASIGTHESSRTLRTPFIYPPTKLTATLSHDVSLSTIAHSSYRHIPVSPLPGIQSNESFFFSLSLHLGPRPLDGFSTNMVGYGSIPLHFFCSFFFGREGCESSLKHSPPPPSFFM